LLFKSLLVPYTTLFRSGVRNDHLVEAVDDRADMIGHDRHPLSHHRSSAAVGKLQESVVLVQSRESAVKGRHLTVAAIRVALTGRSEEHTSELQSRFDLV